MQLRKFNFIFLFLITVFIVQSCSKKVNTQEKKVITTSYKQSLWSEVNPDSVPVIGRQMTLPKMFKVYHLNTGLMHDQLNKTVNNHTNEKVLLQLPMPDGVLHNFAITESPTIASELLKQYPQLRTWSGQGIDDKNATAKIDFNQNGFHAFILSTNGTIYINPFSEGDTLNYISFNKKDVTVERKEPFEVLPDSIKH